MIHDAPPAPRSIHLGDFRHLTLDRLLALIRDVKKREDRRPNQIFVKREPTPLLRFRTIAELVEDIRATLKELINNYPKLEGFQQKVLLILNNIKEAKSAIVLLDVYNSLLAFEDAELPELTRDSRDKFYISADEKLVYIRVDVGSLDTHPEWAKGVKEETSNQYFLASVSAMLEELRPNGDAPTHNESVAIQVAYDLLNRGVMLPTAYQSLGTSGFRDIQTYLAIADPGDGHIAVTTSQMELLRGVVVHIEHIDRDEEVDKEKIEPYRLPAARNAAKVRLHVGMDAPCTAFIGRPVFESDHFRRDLLKSVHMTASACTAMFRNGIADCKIGIEGMPVTQAIEFMLAVVGNVLRDRSRQYLSAAFNINTPIVDDRPETRAPNGGPTVVGNPKEIAKLGIHIADKGGFDKIAWDGASNQVPSIPILDQLDWLEVLELVHMAHERGLETYISAGLEPDHMLEATFTGVDGIGIGTSLHYIDQETNLMGQLKPEAMLEALAVRNKAEKEPFALCVRLLARLDRMFAEGSLQESHDDLRLNLFVALQGNRIDEAQRIAKSEALQEVVDLEPGREHPVLETAKRIKQFGHLDPVAARGMPKKDWEVFFTELTGLVDDMDIRQLEEML